MKSAIFMVLALGFVTNSWAHDGFGLEIHGAMAAGYVVSEGNNVLGSSRNGSNDLVEVAINGRKSIGSKFLVAGQVMARKAGSADDGRVRLDYLQLDYQAWQGMRGAGGIRLGKLKNPLGFFNASRDVVFTRPGILLPMAYMEDTGVRDLLFASEGAQLYASLDSGFLVSDWVIGWGRQRDATDELKRVFGSSEIDGKIELSEFWLAQWLGEWLGGGFRTGMSYLSTGLSLRDSQMIPDTKLFADLWMLSLQALGSNSSLTFEYRITDIRTEGAYGRISNTGDSAYLQYQYRPHAKWSGYLRYDLNFLDRNDRDGRRRAQATGAPRFGAFARDHVVGVQWTPDSNWGLFAEYHYVDGTASVRAADNAGRTPERYWQMFLIMLAYQF